MSCLGRIISRVQTDTVFKMTLHSILNKKIGAREVCAGERVGGVLCDCLPWCVVVQLVSMVIAASATKVIEKLITDVKSDRPTAANTRHLYGNLPESLVTIGAWITLLILIDHPIGIRHIA